MKSNRQQHTLLALALTAVVCIGCNQNAPLPDGNYKYIARNGSIDIHDMDNGHALVDTLTVPQLRWPRGIAANSETDRLYVAHFGFQATFNRIRRLVGMPARHAGFVAAFDLRSGELLWNRAYEPSIDSLAITRDGSTLYMPSGEDVMDQGFWFVLDAETGEEIDRIEYVKGSHNTIAGPSGKSVYLASLQYPYLAVASTASNQIVKKIGPFSESIRPFAINSDESLAFVTVNFLSGFEVGDLNSGHVLHSVTVEGFPWEDPPLPFHQSHGISLTPDEQQVWIVDAYNRHLHIFDVSELPDIAPTQLASIDVSDENHPENLPKWINSSRDGRFMHVSTGHIIETASLDTVARVTPSRYFLQVTFENGEPIKAYSRYGLGYAYANEASVQID